MYKPRSLNFIIITYKYIMMKQLTNSITHTYTLSHTHTHTQTDTLPRASLHKIHSNGYSR